MFYNNRQGLVIDSADLFTLYIKLIKKRSYGKDLFSAL